MGHIFISYASSDAEAAQAVRSVLEANGRECWMAPESVHGPTPWAAQIVGAINNADAMAVLLSEESNGSRHVSREVDLAVDKGLPLVVLRIEEVTPTDTLEYLLRLYQWTDVYSSDVADHAARIMEAVTVSEEKDPTAAPAPKPVSVVPLAPASSLPLPPDTFIGRTMELQEATALLGEARAVTLTGFGGTGKTRLSIELASRAASEFPDGVYFVELAEIDDPDLVPPFVARSLGYSLHDESYEDIDDELASRIAGSRVLMVLDNCEHVIEAAARLSESLLRATTGLRILASSREPLRFSGEQEYRLGSLPTPQDRLSSVAEASEFDAVALFVERAREANPSFTLSAETVEQVTGICVRLDGIPLALELAAARIRAFTVGQIEEMLTDRLALLTGGRRSAAPRHQTLEAAIAWSYDALTSDEQSTFERLSLLRGGFDLAAARAVSEADDVGSDAALVVAGLVEKSLLLATVRPGGMRYRMMETLREYATGKLRAAGRFGAAADQYIGYWESRVLAAETSLLGKGEVAGFDLLHREHANVRSALALAVDRGNDGAAIQLAAGLALLWLELGLWTGGSNWLQRIWSQDASDVTTRSLRRGLVALSEIETPADAVMTMARRASADGESRRAVLLYGAASGLAEILDSMDQKDQWAEEAHRFTDAMDDDTFRTTIEQARNAIAEAASPGS